jgi:hypothetical protein
MFEDYSISIRPFIDTIATLALGSWPKQVLVRVRDKSVARKTHLIFLRMQKCVTEWTLTLPQQLPLRELESQWTLESLGSDCRGQTP